MRIHVRPIRQLAAFHLSSHAVICSKYRSRCAGGSPRHERGSENCFRRAIRLRRPFPRLLLTAFPLHCSSSFICRLRNTPVSTATRKATLIDGTKITPRETLRLRGIGRKGLAAWTRIQVRPSTDVLSTNLSKKPAYSGYNQSIRVQEQPTPSSLNRATRTRCRRLGKNRLRSRTDRPNYPCSIGIIVPFSAFCRLPTGPLRIRPSTSRHHTANSNCLSPRLPRSPVGSPHSAAGSSRCY